MPFEIPSPVFDPHLHATNKITRANQLEQLILQQFISSYEAFWGVSGGDVTTDVDGEPVTAFVGGGSSYSVQEIQSVIDAMPMSTAIDILTDAAQLVGFIDSAYPGVLPDRYKTAAFEYTIGQSGITFTNLAAAWSAPEQ
jgi:hypothetical protein